MTDSNSTARPLQGQVALVTGASRGIGRAIAETLARAGARVVCVATSEANVVETAKACAAHEPGAKAYGVDVSDTNAVADLVKEVTTEYGGIDILVNNAGITRDQLLMRMAEDDFDRVIAVNLKGTWNFVKAAARPLMKAGSGRIINIASVVGVTGNAGQANYAASKAGVIGLTKSTAKELSGRGVTCNAIAPGFIETDMTSDIPENERGKLMGAIPLGRMGSADDIAAATLFLAGPTGSYITGQTLIVDGGLSL
ncbi:3-oxoacyl-[acyl-carrier-protein] reductase FabG [Planctomycetes bacterium Poly30]|uniref:3-oxoacyl-[acyl-carrier-protein] reductase n=1 Tax=Saltatorellus ferox TaxID=2528018 RepID=A0A518ETA4_9BACT|nr:3-oxoacyl-[acyl-carrier-protein] reductase FabG [Planctomycetes bacterium Poly30]